MSVTLSNGDIVSDELLASWKNYSVEDMKWALGSDDDGSEHDSDYKLWATAYKEALDNAEDFNLLTDEQKNWSTRHTIAEQELSPVTKAVTDSDPDEADGQAYAVTDATGNPNTANGGTTTTTITSPSAVNTVTVNGTAEEEGAADDSEALADGDEYNGEICSNLTYSVDPTIGNVYAVEVKVFLEGIEVPQASCAVSYGVNSPATCTIVLPAHRVLRDLPETTRLHIIFKDPIQENGENVWRLLFDGELSGYQYSLSPDGAYMTLSGIHSTSYLTQLQMICMDAAMYMYQPSAKMCGAACFETIAGFNRQDIHLIEDIIKRKDTFKSMADIVYILLSNIEHGSLSNAKAATTGKVSYSKTKKSTEVKPETGVVGDVPEKTAAEKKSGGTSATTTQETSHKRSAVGNMIHNKIGGNDKEGYPAGSWKLLRRIWGVSDEAKNAAYIEWSTTAAQARSTGYSNSGGNSGNTNGNVGSGLQAAINKLENTTMDNHSQGCVEAATKIGSYYSTFLQTEMNNKVASVSVLVNDAQKAGIQIIPFDANSVTAGDVLIYGGSSAEDGHHVNVSLGGVRAFGNSSSNDKVMQYNDYKYSYGDGVTPSYIIKTGN